MLKKIALACSLIGALALGACASTGIPATPGSNVDPTVQAIQDAAIKACGFLPAVSTVSAIVSSFIPGAGGVNALVTQIAGSICNAVAPTGKTASLRRAGPPVVYTSNGPVAVNGTFVK